MAKGVSIHVGVNEVNAPGLNLAPLLGSVNDALRMQDIAVTAGFADTKVILDEQAAYQVVFDAIVEASTKVTDGDIFLFTFSGHGTRQAALQGAEEPDLKDETIVLHDRVMIDNVFKKLLWPKFPVGVRVLAICDSCHSGSALFDSLVAHGVPHSFLTGIGLIDSSVETTGSIKSTVVLKRSRFWVREVERFSNRRFRFVSSEEIQPHFEALKPFYEDVMKSVNANATNIIKARLLTLAACRDNEVTQDGSPNGAFTTALLEVVNNNVPGANISFQGDYDMFLNAISQKLPNQHPVRLPKNPNAEPVFLGQRPFTV